MIGCFLEHAVSVGKETADVQHRTGVHVGKAVPLVDQRMQPGEPRTKVGLLGGTPALAIGTIVERTQGAGGLTHRKVLRTTHHDAAVRC